MSQTRPQPSEYAPYYEKYVSLVRGDRATGALETQRTRTIDLFARLTEQDADSRYAPDKWSVKEVLGHINDAERIFSYRALRIARGDQTPLPGFEQDSYVTNGAFDERTLESLVEEFASVRSATLALFRSFAPAAWLRRGTASEKEVSVRALAFITAGHELHHVKILEERYLPLRARA